MRQPEIVEGGCLCGRVRYRATGPALRGVICHCSKCRRHSGAPVLAFVHFPIATFQWLEREPSWYRSSPFAERGFCPVCGSTIAMREEVLADRVQLCVGSLDLADGIEINDHVWTRERIPWFDVKDDLPRFPESSTAVPSKAGESQTV